MKTHSFRLFPHALQVLVGRSLATMAVALCGLALPSHAFVLVDDTWADGNRTDQNLPTESAWFASTTPSLTTPPGGGSMIGTVPPTNAALWLTYFTPPGTPATLFVGDTLKATLVFTPDNVATGTPPTSRGLRIGLFNYADGGTRVAGDTFSASDANGQNVKGYMLAVNFVQTFTTTPLQILERTGTANTNLMGTTAAYTTLGNGGGASGDPGFANGTQYTLEFSVTRTAPDVVVITARFFGPNLDISYSATDLSDTTYAFDCFAIRPTGATSSAATFTFTRFQVDKKIEAKWDQPPDPAHATNIFYGWNQPSEVTLPGMLIAADDWVCMSTNPVTKIRWWGSYLGWSSNVPPAQVPSAFQILFYTDVPTNATQPFSQPGTVVWQITCTNFTSQFVGYDYDPRMSTYEACFLFEQTLMPWEYFTQPGPTGTIYWISIAASFQLGPEPPPNWGWKTRPRDPTSAAPDDAVMSPNDSAGWNPIFWPDPTNSWDLAFELISSSGGGEAKWEQLPDLSYYGMDVNASTNMPPQIPYLLADDFLCMSPGLLTNITIWGSWTNDTLPGLNPSNVIFTLSIHSDIPAYGYPWYMDYSMPGLCLWTNIFPKGTFTCTQVTTNQYEYWLTPPTNAVPSGDRTCYRYDFNINPANAFYQEGTPTQPIIYWLDVQARPGFPNPASGPKFGWKTSTNHWNDDAVWVNGVEQYNVPPMPPWNRLVYPPNHPYHPESIDLAFRLNGSGGQVAEVKWSQPPVPYTLINAFNGWNQYSVEGYQFVADDWACTNANPVTDIHWWGSFIGWGETNPPPMPDAFIIQIWTDVPAGSDEWFSHPDYSVWGIYCTNFTWSFVGWDWDPRNTNVGPEACFKFEQDLQESEWFMQDPPDGTNIYWLSIAAWYASGQTPEYPWGWKTRPRDTNSLAPDDAVVIDYSSSPPWWPIYWPTTNDSWDMAFALTTREIITPTNDFGDAPSPYPTLLVNNGARHTVAPGVFMGAQIDAELDGQPNPTATGDDATPPPPPPGGDEDGVTLTSPIVPGGGATVQVTASINGYLSAWVDFGGDGSWAEAGDQIFTDVALNPGPNNLTFNVPVGAPPGILTFARFRFSTTTNLTYVGQAPDGEVEDYMWYIEELDYGDAPDPPYPTLLASDGARHAFVPGIKLGNLIDAEVNGQPNATATGDDVANLADEDGVALWGSQMIPGGLAGVTVTASANGLLSAWVDFNVDGSWATPGDQIFTNVPVTNGPNNLTFNVPFAAARGTNTFARFRFSTAAITNFTGLAMDGEVEDYRWYLEELDFGDAQDPTFPTMYANNGAFHWTLLSPRVFLGATVDPEWDGQPNATATGDDANGVPDDEDGVTLLTPLLSGQMGTVQVVAAMSNAYLSAWIDFGADGSWAQAGDQIANNLMLPIAGPNLVIFPVPANAAVGSNVFARFRYSTAQNLSYTNVPGQVPNGEVEDYYWLINRLDFGDAPSPYPTLLANNGARHAIVPGFYLGSLEDGETNGLPHAQALGDDLDNTDDEDGVTVVPLVIGSTQACLTVTLGGTNSGALDVWIDFNTNGSWLDSGEQVCTSVALAPGSNNVCFAVPATAKPGTTFARFRLSSAGGLLPTGQAPDGEVEDHRFTLGWPRPSTNIWITNFVFTAKFNGWNEPSMDGATNIAADDWVCISSNPVTDIRWWGSFLGWRSNTPPALPSSFSIMFWSDVPAGGGGFSHPGLRLWEVYCTNYTWQFVGWDLDPRTLEYEACFRFDQKLMPHEWFYQTNQPAGTNIYWLSIAAVYQTGVPESVWGWKTRPRDTNSPAPDDAVRFNPTSQWYEPIYWPDPTNSWDLAFELQSSGTSRSVKWEQLPDLSYNGMDVNCTSNAPPPNPYLLADDFLCTSLGPLTNITIWGSWTNDLVPGNSPTNIWFTLSIHADIPPGMPPYNEPYSMPGQVLWMQTFAPGQFAWSVVQTNSPEWWLNPGYGGVFPGDWTCYRYDFSVPSTNVFVQEGTEMYPIIYWLDVQARPGPTGMASRKFGWKTSTNHWNDDACWAMAVEPYNGVWNNLVYPLGHQFENQTVDLAFRLNESVTTFNQLKWSQPPVSRWYVTVEWTWETGLHYQLQATSSLSNAPSCTWENVGPELIGPVHEQSDTNTTAPERYYRVVAPDVVP